MERQKADVTRPNGRAQVEAEARSDGRRESLKDGARQLPRFGALGTARVGNVRRGRSPLGTRNTRHDPRGSDEGPGAAFHFPDAPFAAGAVKESQAGSAMQSAPSSCSSSLGSSSATATCAWDPRERHGDSVSLGIEVSRDRAFALFAADSLARARGKSERAGGGGGRGGVTGCADPSSWVVDASAFESPRLPAKRLLFIARPRRSLATRRSRGRPAGHLGELGLVRDDFARQIVDEAAPALELFDEVFLELYEAALGFSAGGGLRVVGDLRSVREPELHVDGERLHVDLEVALGAVARPTEPGELSEEQRLVVGAIQVLAKGGLHDEARRRAHRRAVGGELSGQRRVDVGLKPDSLISHDAPPLVRGSRRSTRRAGRSSACSPRRSTRSTPSVETTDEPVMAARCAWFSDSSGCGCDGTSVDRSAHARCFAKSTCGGAICAETPAKPAEIQGVAADFGSRSDVARGRRASRTPRPIAEIGGRPPRARASARRGRVLRVFARRDVFETA